MLSGKVKILTLIIFVFICSPQLFAQSRNENYDEETLQNSLQLIKSYFYGENNWYIAEPKVGENVKGLINFIDDQPLDTIIKNLNSTFVQNGRYVFRLPENVEDSLTVPGYYPINYVERDIEKMGVRLQREFQNKNVHIPQEFTSNLEEKLNLIPEGEGIQLFTDSLYIIPDSLQIPEVIPDSLLNSPENFEILRRTDSLRNSYIENKRIYYNDSITSSYIDSLTIEIRTREFERELDYQSRRISDSVRVNNYYILKAYNDSISNEVNSSISAVLKSLIEYADFVDTTYVSIINLTGDTTDIRLQNGNERFSRVWLKNEQNDSLSVLVKNTNKRSMQMLIDDGVTISRYRPKETKNFDFKTLEKEVSDFTNVGKSYEVETPWRIGGDGNVGFTQTYLKNWKKGGQSAFSLLLVLKGFANYSSADGKMKWENSAEIRNGWLRPGGKGAELQKNDDKFEFTSRYGISAFKKWYYSAEFNFETQFFKGYTYPTSDNPDPISAFMAPGKTFFKLGLEYKPNKDFSLLLSPITLKNMYVRDTVLIDQTKFSISADRKSFWEPGLNADLKFRKEITEDITYETKYKMFINYQNPFQKFDVNWENTFQMRLTDYINMRLMVHFIYDDDVLFDGEPKLQTKEFFTIGFAYKINRKVMKAKRIR